VRSENGEASLEEAKLIGQKIAETVTSSLPEPMELVFEAFARRGIFLAKKRYALWVFEPMGETWKDRIKVRGMETVRRDWCNLTSKTLKTCLELVLKEGKVEEAVNHVRSVVARLQDLDLSTDPAILEDLTMTRRYTKSMASYKNKQPHIQLVDKIKNRGGQVPGVGDRVPFVIISGGKIRYDEFRDATLGSKTLFVNRAEDPQYALAHNCCIDTEYYIEKQILPPLLRIFDSFGITRVHLIPNSNKFMHSISGDCSKDELSQGKEQSNLFSFEGNSQRVQKQKSLFDF
jgi:DNA polymerase, archaea type